MASWFGDYFGVGGDGPTPTPAPGEITARTVVRDAHGNAQAGIRLKYRLTAVPASVESGTFPTDLQQTDASGDDGAIEVDVIKGATYEFWTPIGRPVSLTAPTEGNSFDLPPIIGRYT